jgi:3D (Asp-Asp-Asp) domain-containing protein
MQSAVRKRIVHLTLLACCSVSNAGVVSQEDFAIPAPTSVAATEVNVWATYYHVRIVAESGVGYPLRDKLGAPLTGNLPPRDWCLGAIEGTIQVSSAGVPKTYNYSGIGRHAWLDCAKTLKIDAEKRPWISATGNSYFAIAKGRFGDGVAGYALVPYRTIAVDPASIPFGTVLYIPRARGASIHIAPGNTIQHDGYFFAADRGGGIKGQHIDVFCGTTAQNCLPSIVRSDPNALVKAQIIEDASVAAKLSALHSP